LILDQAVRPPGQLNRPRTPGPDRSWGQGEGRGLVGDAWTAHRRPAGPVGRTVGRHPDDGNDRPGRAGRRMDSPAGNVLGGSRPGAGKRSHLSRVTTLPARLFTPKLPC